MKLITCFGELFEVTDRDYKLYMRVVANGDDAEVPGKSMGVIAMNVTDITPEIASLELDALEGA